MLDTLGNLKRTHYSGELRPEHAGEKVTLMGWVHRRRDFGPLTFIDLRDREGVVQVVFDEEKGATVHRRAKELRGEYVVVIVGKVVMRDKDKINPNIKSGRVEIIGQELFILNEAKTPPFEMDTPKASEDVRLKYRYLDLRRAKMQQNIQLRHRAAFTVRRYLMSTGSSRSKPDDDKVDAGGRPRLHRNRWLSPGNFYALPQSPQIFSNRSWSRVRQILSDRSVLLTRTCADRQPGVHPDRCRDELRPGRGRLKVLSR
jgi:aspartyl-tRNA synthetase